MGIQGLLPGLKFCTSTHVNIRDVASGHAVAVDVSSWLHKSVYSIADHYVEYTETHDRVDERCIAVASRYIISRCQELLSHAGVTRVYLVFDGQRCPLKSGTNHEREQRRQLNLQTARECRQALDRETRRPTTRPIAATNHNHPTNHMSVLQVKMFEKYKACIKIRKDLTEAVATAVMNHRFQPGGNHRTSRTVPSPQFLAHNKCGADASSPRPVQLIWSPFEADAQLCQLCIDGRASVIISEDSDILVYALATRTSLSVVYKFDRNSGSCDVIDLTKWFLDNDRCDSQGSGDCPYLSVQQGPTRSSSSHRPTAVYPGHPPRGGKHDRNAGVGLRSILEAFRMREQREAGVGVRLFVQACVLSGCDYAPNQLTGVGTIKAFQHVRQAIHRPPERRFHSILHQLPRHIIQSVPPPASSSVSAPPSVTETSNETKGFVEAYEELLVKSEAVFYYHPVRDRNNRIVLLSDVPSSSEAESHQNSSQSQLHKPTLERFPRHQWQSFLGDYETAETLHQQLHLEIADTQYDENATRLSSQNDEIQPITSNDCQLSSSVHLEIFSNLVNAPAPKPVISNPYAISKTKGFTGWLTVNSVSAKARPENADNNSKPPDLTTNLVATENTQPPTEENAGRSGLPRKSPFFSSVSDDVGLVKRTFPKDGTRLYKKQKLSVLGQLATATARRKSLIDITNLPTAKRLAKIDPVIERIQTHDKSSAFDDIESVDDGNDFDHQPNQNTAQIPLVFVNTQLDDEKENQNTLMYDPYDSSPPPAAHHGSVRSKFFTRKVTNEKLSERKNALTILPNTLVFRIGGENPSHRGSVFDYYDEFLESPNKTDTTEEVNEWSPEQKKLQRTEEGDRNGLQSMIMLNSSQPDDNSVVSKSLLGLRGATKRPKIQGTRPKKALRPPTTTLARTTIPGQLTLPTFLRRPYNEKHVQR